MDQQPRVAKIFYLPRVLPAIKPGVQQRFKTPGCAGGEHFRAYWLAWWTVAWWVAVSHLSVAVARRKVFAPDEVAAFVVAVVLPLMSAGTLWAMIRDVGRLIARRAKSTRPRSGDHASS